MNAFPPYVPKNLDNNPVYPAACPIDNIITVAASDEFDNLASFSNYGPNSVHIAAPGVGIDTTIFTGSTSSYDYKDGTSFAAPFVTGAVALVWAQHPTWNYHQVRDHILNTAHKGLLGNKVIAGRRLDIGAALVDCNNNGVVDGLDVYNHTSQDCNGNNIPDECDAPGAFGACCLPSGACVDHYKSYTFASAHGDFLGTGTMCGCSPGCGIFGPQP